MANELEIIPPQEVVAERTPTELDADLDFARDNLRDMAEIAKMAVQELAQIASQSSNYLAYEKLAALLKSAADVNKDVVNVSQTKDILNRPPEPIKPPQEAETTNNILFTGSTSDMADLLKQLKQKNG